MEAILKAASKWRLPDEYHGLVKSLSYYGGWDGLESLLGLLAFNCATIFVSIYN